VVFVRSLLTRIEQQKFLPLDPLRMQTIYTLDQLEALQKVLEHLAKDRAIRDTYMMGARSKRQQRENR
jgi:hypothetical protein